MSEEEKIEAPKIEAQKEISPQEDIIQRVTGFLGQNKPEAEKIPEDFHFDANDIDKIEDPSAKEYAKNAHKSLEKSYQKKFQDLADIRKTMESALSQEKGWTKERVERELLNNPEFVKVAQEIAGQDGTSNDEYSALSDSEKSKIQQMEQQLSLLKQQNTQAYKSQQDQEFKNKYKNYNPEAIDTLTAELIQGKTQATREHLYKVLNHDENVKNAYEMGRKDALEGKKERMESSSAEGLNVTPISTPIEREEGVSKKQYIRDVFRNALAKTQAGKV